MYLKRILLQVISFFAAKIGVIHPIEPYWLKWGNEENTGAERAEMDEAGAEHWIIQVPGAWTVEQYDAMEGTVLPIQAEYLEEECCTKWEVTAYVQDSFLYFLQPGRTEGMQEVLEETEAQRTGLSGRALSEAKYQRAEGIQHAVKIPEQISVTLEEPNVLVLDMAEFKVDDGCWKEKEEILRLDNVLRSELDYAKRKVFADLKVHLSFYGKTYRFCSM